MKGTAINKRQLREPFANDLIRDVNVAVDGAEWIAGDHGPVP